MNPDIIKKFVNDPTLNKVIVEVTKSDVHNELYAMCASTHEYCNFDCLVFERVICECELDETKFNSCCPYFKNGMAMLERLQGKRIKTNKK